MSGDHKFKVGLPTWLCFPAILSSRLRLGRLDLSSIYLSEDTRVGVGYNGLMVGFVLGKERKKSKGELGTE